MSEIHSLRSFMQALEHTGQLVRIKRPVNLEYELAAATSALERLAWLTDKRRADKPAQTAFFVGCTSAFVRQNMAVDTIGTLERLGVDYSVLRDE